MAKATGTETVDSFFWHRAEINFAVLLDSEVQVFENTFTHCCDNYFLCVRVRTGRSHLSSKTKRVKRFKVAPTACCSCALACCITYLHAFTRLPPRFFKVCTGRFVRNLNIEYIDLP